MPQHCVLNVRSKAQLCGLRCRSASAKLSRASPNQLDWHAGSAALSIAHGLACGWPKQFSQLAVLAAAEHKPAGRPAPAALQAATRTEGRAAAAHRHGACRGGASCGQLARRQRAQEAVWVFSLLRRVGQAPETRALAGREEQLGRRGHALRQLSTRQHHVTQSPHSQELQSLSLLIRLHPGPAPSAAPMPPLALLTAPGACSLLPTTLFLHAFWIHATAVYFEPPGCMMSHGSHPCSCSLQVRGSASSARFTD